MELSEAELQAIPLISRAGVTMLRQNGLRIVADADIVAFQAAYTRLRQEIERLAAIERPGASDTQT